MRVLVAQATRMGDVLQTSPLIRMIRLAHPDAEIDVLVRRMGTTIARRHPDVAEVIVYDEDEMFRHLNAGDSDRLLRAYAWAEQYVTQLRAREYDLAYNVTHSLASAMLMALSGIPRVVGAHLTEDGAFVLRGDWTTYFFTAVFNREYNDLNLCDITRQFAREAPPHRALVFEVSEEDRAEAAQLCAEAGAAEAPFLACFQLGASEENKRWDPEHFAGLAQRLRADYGAQILLVGVQEEAPLGERMLQTAPGTAMPLYGRTSIPVLAALLERSHVLVTNDTGTMHIAAAVQCPVALVSVGHVHYRETGPYGAGHIAVEWRRRLLGSGHHVPGGLEERSLVQPAHVLEAVRAVRHYRETGEVPQLADREALHDVDLQMTDFAPDGCLEYYPLLKRPLTQRDLLRIAYRAMWLSRLAPEHATPENEAASWVRLLPCFDEPDGATLEDWVARAASVFEGLAVLAQRGLPVCDTLLDALSPPRDIESARARVAELMRLDEEARIYSEMNPETKPLIWLARY